jgi:hypothetical protein
MPKPKVVRATNRDRGTNFTVGAKKQRRVVATGLDPTTGKSREFASVGRYSSTDSKGRIVEDVGTRNRMRNINRAANALVFGGGLDKTAALFGDSMMGGADIVDSQNIGYYSYEFPVDALELPQSRAEELRFYRLAYDRDPIVSRAINMHVELPLSKMTLEKPKCSSEEFKDYIFDWYQGLINDKKLFSVLIDGAREFWLLGECFFYIEEKQKTEPCPVAKKQIDEEEKGESSDPGKESEFNPPMGGSAGDLMDWIEPTRKASLIKKAAAVIDTIKKGGLSFNPDESLKDVIAELKKKKAALLKLQRKVAKVIGRVNQKDEYPIQVTADISKIAEPPVPGANPAPEPGKPGADPNVEPAPGSEGAPQGPDGMADVDVPGGGAGVPPMGGGGGGAVTPADLGGEVKDAVALGVSIDEQRELMEMRHYLKLLERKKQLLEELQELREKRKEELELFSHVTNPNYRGFFRIQILPPEQMEMSNEGTLEDGPTIYYKPPEAQKEQYLESENTPAEVKDKIQEEGKIPLNQDPFKGSYVIHFARKKANYELHGRSIVQPVIRSCIYREKLRQVQSTIASRNMTPKTMVTAPGVPLSEIMQLRAHIDEAKADPDYTIVVNYDAQWNEIGSEARLLALDGEYQHTNSDLAIGLGLSPEILIGEGLYSGNRIQLEILNTAYLQFRDLITGIVEDLIFKPLAMKKGFYEIDKWGRPRWIFPKVTFSRMALRDSGDLFDMMFNLYAKGSLPVSIIYEFLNIDSEDCKRKLEDDLFTVNDAKFSELLSTLYSSMADLILSKSDLLKRVIEGLTLNEVDTDDQGPEGSGEGM